MDNYVTKILSEFNLIVVKLVPDSYNHIAIIAAPCLLGVLTLAIIVFGLKTMMGQIQNPREIYPFIWKMLIVIVLIGGWGEITRLFYDSVSSATLWFGDKIMNVVASVLNVGNVMPKIPGVSSLGVQLNIALKTFHLISHEIAPSHWYDVSAEILSFMVWLFGWGVVALGMLEIVVGQFVVAYLFVLLPVVAIFAPFDKTKDIFERHVRLMFGFGFMLIFVPAVIGFILSWIKWSLILGKVITITGIPIGIPKWEMLIPFLIVGFISLGLVVLAAFLAKQVGGGTAAGSGAALLAGAAGGVMGGIFAAKKFLKPAGYPIKHPKKTLKGSKIASKFTGQMAMKTARLAARLYNAA